MTKFTRSRTGKIAEAASDTSCKPIGCVGARCRFQLLPAGSDLNNRGDSGEQGMGTSSSATNQTWDQTYQSDKAQEEQLKKGGKSGWTITIISTP